MVKNNLHYYRFRESCSSLRDRFPNRPGLIRRVVNSSGMRQSWRSIFAGAVFLFANTAICCGQAHDWTEPIQSHVINLFDARWFTYSGGKYRDQEFAYRLFIPSDLAVDQDYPVLVWTSGYGERGNDNVGQLMHLDHLFKKNRRSSYRFFVLAMQNPPDSNGWFLPVHHPQEDEAITVLMALLEQVAEDHPIDKNRVYLSGVSHGGSACWEIAMRNPHRFAAVVPLASEVINADTSRLNRIKDVPVWAFHCSRDPSTSPASVREAVAKLSRLGGAVHLTEIDAMSHDCWTAAFESHHIMDWMLSHSKGNNGYPPGTRPWRLYHIVAAPLLFMTILVICYKELRKQKSDDRQTADSS